MASDPRRIIRQETVERQVVGVGVGHAATPIRQPRRRAEAVLQEVCPHTIIIGHRHYV